MNSKDYIKDIQMFINEAYSDNEPLQENQIKSKQVFNDYCNEISQDLDRLEKALEIIKKCRIKVEKREDFDVVSYATFRKNGKYRYYINDIEITQEEFDLLKEVLENE